MSKRSADELFSRRNRGGEHRTIIVGVKQNFSEQHTREVIVRTTSRSPEAKYFDIKIPWFQRSLRVLGLIFNFKSQAPKYCEEHCTIEDLYKENPRLQERLQEMRLKNEIPEYRLVN